MLIFLFSIMLICFGVYYSMMNRKLSTQKTQLRVITMQNRDFKSKIANARNDDGPIVIKYKTPLFKTGTTNDSCNLYLYPMENSPVLTTIVKDASIVIQDSAEVFNISWYEVSLKSQTNINNKGWIKKDNLITIDDTVNNQEESPIN